MGVVGSSLTGLCTFDFRLSTLAGFLASSSQDHGQQNPRVDSSSLLPAVRPSSLDLRSSSAQFRPLF